MHMFSDPSWFFKKAYKIFLQIFIDAQKYKKLNSIIIAQGAQIMKGNYTGKSIWEKLATPLVCLTEIELKCWNSNFLQHTGDAYK